MSDTQVKVVPPSMTRRILMRIVSILTAMVLFSLASGFVTGHSGSNAEPAGFARGMLHGAMMPASMMNLMLGRDVTIYDANNTGRMYKLGYTTGVNGCGAIFFGIFFWRVTRWRKRQKEANA